MKMSQRAYARYRRENGLRPWSRGAVRLSVQQGVIDVNEDGEVDPAQADRAMEGLPPKRPNHSAQKPNHPNHDRSTTRTREPGGPPVRRPDGQVSREMWREGIQDAATVLLGLVEPTVSWAGVDVGLEAPAAVAVARLAHIWLWGELNRWLGEEVKVEWDATLDWELLSKDTGKKFDPDEIEKFWHEFMDRLGSEDGDD